MKKQSYEQIREYLHICNEEMSKFFNTIYTRRQKERKKFEKKYKRVSADIKRARKTDGII
ncbi:MULTISPECIES: hypothetical protein [unclassified Nitratiruptor]|uniref:hypothetical protein n=1 Tax=unclassified Nitratiruptor TaxID=2624044 RepID=UPI00191542C6|nr:MULTISPECIES: hypothetical protein [unclassified Nitratiruptor]BCD59610.1 hypothetical protein NitYY0810_C0361 [Nitratiruptor sp. YY08-10]BCD63534.1 hypothetical protein NitYY0814_C0361 [Nitratiruptor sp. YY08-14]BCD83086.1 hypothetical protein NrS2_36 [Nitratiruptor phage NrS-2]BCD83152.1 hypothetical protein NrS3_36 [Nitratiruptor phage NrS-3]